MFIIFCYITSHYIILYCFILILYYIILYYILLFYIDFILYILYHIIFYHFTSVLIYHIYIYYTMLYFIKYLILYHIIFIIFYYVLLYHIYFTYIHIYALPPPPCAVRLVYFIVLHFSLHTYNSPKIPLKFHIMFIYPYLFISHFGTLEPRFWSGRVELKRRRKRRDLGFLEAEVVEHHQNATKI